MNIHRTVKQLTGEELVRKRDNLIVKVDVTPRFLGRFIYANMLAETEDEINLRVDRSTHLDLCRRHQQEHYHSVNSEDNCDHCKLLKLIGEVNE